MGDTKTALVRDLEAKESTPVRDTLIERARRGYYHDFDSPLPTPKIQAVMDLRDAGYEDLAQKVVDGAYDDERPTIEQEEELRLQLSPAIYDAIMGKPRPEN